LIAVNKSIVVPNAGGAKLLGLSGSWVAFPGASGGTSGGLLACGGNVADNWRQMTRERTNTLCMAVGLAMCLSLACSAAPSPLIRTMPSDATQLRAEAKRSVAELLASLHDSIQQQKPELSTEKSNIHRGPQRVQVAELGFYFDDTCIDQRGMVLSPWLIHQTLLPPPMV